MLSTKPYLLRALYEWCLDQSFTPYVAVVVDERTTVPQAYIKDGQIVLNIGPEAAHQLVIGNERVTLSARFSGVAHNLSIPIDRVAAIYARENGHGMAFEVDAGTEQTEGAAPESPPHEPAAPQPPADKPPSSPRPHLVRVK